MRARRDAAHRRGFAKRSILKWGKGVLAALGSCATILMLLLTLRVDAPVAPVQPQQQCSLVAVDHDSSRYAQACNVTVINGDINVNGDVAIPPGVVINGDTNVNGGTMLGEGRRPGPSSSISLCWLTDLAEAKHEQRV